MGLPAKRLRKAHDSDNEFDYYDDELNVSHGFFFFFCRFVFNSSLIYIDSFSC